MKKFRYFLEFVPVWILDQILNLLPAAWAYALGEQLGLLMSKIIAKRHRLILENLAHAFPEKTAVERARIACGVWKNLGRTAVEFIRLPKLLKSVSSTVEWEGAEHVVEALAKGHGVILLTAHFTNWEFLGVLVNKRFGNITSIARPIKNPFVENWVQSKRRTNGMKIILHRNAVKASLKVLRAKESLGVLVDQNLYTGGVFVNFFGRPAATTTLPALLQSRTDATIIIAVCLRENNTFRVLFEPPLPALKSSDAEAVSAHTQLISTHLENIIRRYPENWFWIHNRWKRKI